MNKLLITITLLGFFNFKTAHADTVRLFNEISHIQPPRTSPLPYINRSFSVELNLDELKFGPDRLRIDLGIDESVFINKLEFIPRDGYLIQDSKTFPDPELPNNEISYMWSGHSDNYDVVLTVHNGQISGIVTGNTRRFLIYQTLLTHLRLPGLINPENFLTDVVIPTKSYSNNPQKNTPISHLKKVAYNDQLSTRSHGTNNIDVLVLWTEKTRRWQNGDPDDLNDTQGLDTHIQAAIDNTNTTLINSHSKTRIGTYYSAKFEVQDETASYEQNLFELTNSQVVQSLRNEIGADVVSLVLKNFSFYNNNCGASYSQTIPNQLYQPGTEFNQYAYNIVETQCAIMYNSFAHELGHILGANHTRDEMDSNLVDDISNNGFADAFAWAESEINSSMTINPEMLSRRLHFSNPLLEIGGTPLGNTDQANNIRVMDQLSTIVSQYRIGPDKLFTNDFEIQN